MKNMDYEKAYKAVLQTATQWINDGCTDKEKICLECVFPELRESEKPMQDGLEEEISRTYHDGSVTDTSDLDHVSYENIARHFYELGCHRTAEKYDEIEYNRQSAEDGAPKDLEEAANKFAVFYDQGTCDGIAQDCFIAGAKWQAEQLLKSSPLPEDTVLFNKGVAEGRRLAEEEQADLFTIVALDAAQRAKEQMMKEAVEGEVESFSDMHQEVTIPLNPTMFKVGDKVRVIIIKDNNPKFE